MVVKSLLSRQVKEKIAKETFYRSTRRLQTIEFSKVIEDINKINSPLERLQKLEEINNDCSIVGDSFTKQKNIQLTTAQERSFKPGELNIIIIGSGPCGLYLANALKFSLRKKINILIIDNKCNEKHFKQPFSRRWLSHLPKEFFEPYFEPSFYELISGFGRNGFVGLPINIIELILFFSAKSLGVQFYFDRYFDLLKLNPDLITFAVDASGGRLDDELKTKNTYRQEIIELKHQFLDLGYAGVSQLSSSPIVEQGQVHIKLKELGRYYYPYLNENPIRLPMIKLTSIPLEVKSDVLDFIQKNNQKNQYYLWEGDLIDEINELLVIINLTENEYMQLINQITKTLLLHDFMRIFENQKSQITVELFTFLNKLDELDKKNQIYIEKPFVTKPSINLSPTTQNINGIHVYPFGDSLLTGNPKVGNALGSNLPFISDFVSYITRMI